MVEIGCIEMVGRMATGRTFHAFFNPQMPMPPEAERVHGHSDAFLADKPLFHERAGELLEFLGDAVLSVAISALLFERFAGSDEGDLTRVRAHLVREESLHRVALVLGLPDVLRDHVM